MHHFEIMNILHEMCENPKPEFLDLYLGFLNQANDELMKRFNADNKIRSNPIIMHEVVFNIGALMRDIHFSDEDKYKAFKTIIHAIKESDSIVFKHEAYEALGFVKHDHVERYLKEKLDNFSDEIMTDIDYDLYCTIEISYQRQINV